MTIKTVTLNTKLSFENNPEKVSGRSPETTLYLNENVVFSEISEEEKLIKSKSIDIDLTQQNKFSILLSDIEEGIDTLCPTTITLNSTGGTGYNVIFNVNISEVYHSNLNKFINFKFKINDTIVKNQANVVSDDLPITSNSSINWNGTDKLSFYIDYQVESLNGPFFNHNTELSLS